MRRSFGRWRKRAESGSFVVIFSLLLASNALAAILTGAIDQTPLGAALPAVNMLLLSPSESNNCQGCHGGFSPKNARINEIWLANLDVGVLNTGDYSSEVFPVKKTVIPVGGNNSFRIDTAEVSDYDILIMANTKVSNPRDVIVGLIAIPDAGKHLIQIPLERLAANLDLGLVVPGNGLGVAKTTLAQAAPAFSDFSEQDLAQMALVNDMARTVVNAYVNYDPSAGRLVGTRIGTQVNFSGLSAGAFTSVLYDWISGYSPHFRTNKGNDDPKWLYPPQEVPAGGGEPYGPETPMLLGNSHDGDDYYTYFAGQFDGNSPPSGYWLVKDGSGSIVAQADLSVLGAFDESGNPILMPSIRPNVNEEGLVTSIDTRWFTNSGGTLREITSPEVLNRVVRGYGFQTNVKDPDRETYYFPGNVTGNTQVPWAITFAQITTGDNSYIKVNVELYGATFECYFAE